MTEMDPAAALPPIHRELRDAIESPHHRASVLWQQASDLLEQAPGHTLERREVGESAFVVTPAYNSGNNYSLKNIGDNHSFAVAARIDKRAKRYSPDEGLPLYLVIDDNLRRPVLQFDKYGEGMVLLDDTPATVVDKKIPALLSGIKSEMASKEWQRRERRRRRVVIAGSVGGVLTAAAVAAGAVGYNVYQNHEEKAAYDALGVELAAEPIAGGEAGFVVQQSGIFSEYIPKMVDERIVRSPRLTEVEAGECTQLGPIGLSDSVLLVTDGPTEQVFAALGNDGTVNVCALKDGDAGSNEQPDYQIAIQRTNGPS